MASKVDVFSGMLDGSMRKELVFMRSKRASVGRVDPCASGPVHGTRTQSLELKCTL